MMKLLQFKRPDGEPLYCWAEAISVWTLATDKENPGRNTDIWIGGKMFTVADTVEQITKVLSDL